ncbi:MAG: hypothetical protein ACRDHF_17790, partial [Tepidiformaceae bacterium]
MVSRVMVVGLLVAALLAADASAARRTVQSESGFQRAVREMRWSGGTIVLRAGRYGHLRIGPRPGRWLTVRARPGAVTRLVEVHGSRRVRLVRLTMGNYRGYRAYLDVHRSRQVSVLRARVRGRSGLSARASVTNSRQVTI